MYAREDLPLLKGAVKSAIERWGTAKIEELFRGNPLVGHYLRKGLHNALAQADHRMNTLVDRLALFVADEQGNIDTDTLLDDAVKLFREMEVSEARMGIFTLRVGRGEVVIEIPPHPLGDLFFGKLGTVRFTSEDFLELKELLTAG